MPLIQLSADSYDFPPVDYALNDPNGLLALGGDLSPQRLISAYQNGIFPWFSSDDPILWWSPDPRAVLIPQQLHISRSMAKFIKKTPLSVTINQAFEQVISACSSERDEGTWIDLSIQQSYCQLHQQGIAHSVEVWHEGDLVGGLYGVEQGALFCGESMFSRQTNASKLALYAFCCHFLSYGGKLIDCQILNDHTESLGAMEIPRADYLQFLYKLQQESLPQACWTSQKLR
ncbi:leucyl/phenylalanyl-tRNA--protein transferase [Pragia fontium]|uniref:leucyl/phenylalanyl-tRNA--protein transferase n=1 Tax=Pragia fontium TaxID=82985 RepID=UPI000DFCEBF3|nr:leucyl/phenylalanyl-tRNA--protein transferase [Pragia fontium]SUB82984.1 Leucyl/phenylalanyl-tRNA--protein transferase [Pragia fontium]VEJ55884.1 Leucyl/phenylalanyl-tRNA--protein transferase [Pragia fontium]